MSTAGRLRSALERRAARGYVARDMGEALALARRLDTAGIACTLGYWDGPSAPGANAAGEAHRALAALKGLDAVVAVEAPPLLDGMSPAAAAAALAPAPPPVRLVVDAPSPDAADGGVALAVALAQRGCDAGIALPGRWQRSVEDAEVAVAHGLAVRLVKGEHADPSSAGPRAAEGLVALSSQLGRPSPPRRRRQPRRRRRSGRPRPAPGGRHVL